MVRMAPHRFEKGRDRVGVLSFSKIIGGKIAVEVGVHRRVCFDAFGLERTELYSYVRRAPALGKNEPALEALGSAMLHLVLLLPKARLLEPLIQLCLFVGAQCDRVTRRWLVALTNVELEYQTTAPSTVICLELVSKARSKRY